VVVAGQITLQIRAAAGAIAIRIVRPGTVYDVQYSAGTGKATVKENIAGFMGLLNRVHHIGGLWHDYALTNAWAIFVALVSAGLVVISATGLYLWFKLRPERRVGAVLLSASLLVSLTLMVLLRAG